MPGTKPRIAVPNGRDGGKGGLPNQQIPYKVKMYITASNNSNSDRSL